MEQKTLKVYAMRVDEEQIYKGSLETIPDTLDAFRKFVGGAMTIVSLNREIELVLNDEGKIEGLPLNRIWRDERGAVLDILVGSVFACRHDSDGNLADILEEDIPEIQKWLPAVGGICDDIIFKIEEEELPAYEEKP